MKRTIPITGLAVAIAVLAAGAVIGMSVPMTAAKAPALMRALPFQAEGQQLLEAKCTTCHDLGGVDEFRESYDEMSMRELIRTMVSYGAQLSEAEIDTLVTYLTTDGSAVDISAAADLVTASCSTCHDLTGIEPGLYPESDWQETVNRMMGYGLALSAEQVETIVSYLGSSGAAQGATDAAFDEAAAETLVNARCTTCHDLSAVERGQYPPDEWRETVNRMLGYGLTLSAEEFETVITYLGTAPGGQADAGAGAALDEAAAEMLVNARCTSCHDLSAVERGQYPPDEWRETVNRMMGYGLALTEEEFDTIINFLGTAPGAADAGAGAPFDETAAEALVNARCTSCHDLSGVERGVYEPDDWRETVNRMMGYGLALSAEEFETIITYLGTAPGAE